MTRAEMKKFEREARKIVQRLRAAKPGSPEYKVAEKEFFDFIARRLA